MSRGKRGGRRARRSDDQIGADGTQERRHNGSRRSRGRKPRRGARRHLGRHRQRRSGGADRGHRGRLAQPRARPPRPWTASSTWSRRSCSGWASGFPSARRRPSRTASTRSRTCCRWRSRCSSSSPPTRSPDRRSRPAGRRPASTQLVIAGVVVTIVATWVYGWYAMRLGKRVSSPALVADGKHRQTDVLSTSLALVAVISTYAGFNIDRVAAVVILAFAVYAGWGLLVARHEGAARRVGRCRHADADPSASSSRSHWSRRSTRWPRAAPAATCSSRPRCACAPTISPRLMRPASTSRRRSARRSPPWSGSACTSSPGGARSSTSACLWLRPRRDQQRVRRGSLLRPRRGARCRRRRAAPGDAGEPALGSREAEGDPRGRVAGRARHRRADHRARRSTRGRATCCARPAWRCVAPARRGSPTSWRCCVPTLCEVSARRAGRRRSCAPRSTCGLMSSSGVPSYMGHARASAPCSAEQPLDDEVGRFVFAEPATHQRLELLGVD